MKNAMRLILAGMLCAMLAAQEPENQEPEKEEVEDYLEKCDANENGTITYAEARACGLETPSRRITPLTSTRYHCQPPTCLRQSTVP